MVPTVKFSEQALIDILDRINVVYPYIILAQAKLESANYSSKLFRTNNNLFGMRHARKRLTASEMDKGGYAYYRDWIDCVYDRGMWDASNMCDISSEDEYFARLSLRYAEDPNYIPKLKTIIQKEHLRELFAD